MKGKTPAPLTEREWRMIHNALSVHQSQFVKFDPKHLMVGQIQQLMDKVRDNYITKHEH
jgi:hypothetical protein